jgi:hypothetical protein
MLPDLEKGEKEYTDPHLYEIPFRDLSLKVSWLMPIAFMVWVAAMSILHLLIPERDREWDFGVVPDVPGSSVYSSFQLQDRQRGLLLQFPPLPEAVPVQPAAAEGRVP